MSDRPCNRCVLDDMERRARERGAEVITAVEEGGWVSARYSDEAEPCAWFMALPEKCMC